LQNLRDTSFCLPSLFSVPSSSRLPTALVPVVSYVLQTVLYKNGIANSSNNNAQTLLCPSAFFPSSLSLSLSLFSPPPQPRSLHCFNIFIRTQVTETTSIGIKVIMNTTAPFSIGSSTLPNASSVSGLNVDMSLGTLDVRIVSQSHLGCISLCCLVDEFLKCGAQHIAHENTYYCTIVLLNDHASQNIMSIK
jgi:hypothetical protein